MKTTGKVRAIEMRPLPTANSVAVSAQIICVDETGAEFTFRATCFNRELKPYCRDQELPYYEWCREVIERDRRFLVKWNKINLEPDYRAGLTPHESYTKHYEARNT